MIEKVVEVGRASRNGPSCCEEKEEGVEAEVEEWRLLATPDIIGSSGFSFELRTPECASVSGRSNSKEKSGSELADAHAITFVTGTGSPSQIVAIISIHNISLPPRTVPPVKAGPNVDYSTCDRANHCCQKKSTLSNFLEDSESKDILPVMPESGTCTGPGGEESIMGDQIMTFPTAGHKNTVTSMIRAVRSLSQPENTVNPASVPKSMPHSPPACQRL